MKLNAHKGFTLIELVIVVGIIAILAATAMNFYGDNVAKSRCTEGRAALLTGASSLEKCKSIYGVYDDSNCNITAFLGDTPDGHFSVTMDNDATTFTLTATVQAPGGGAASNAFCSTITLTNLGIQGGTGSAPW